MEVGDMQECAEKLANLRGCVGKQDRCIGPDIKYCRKACGATGRVPGLGWGCGAASV